MVNIIHGSNIPTLRFESDKLYAQFHQASIKLHWEFYGKIIEQSGIWAGNQGKFVQDPKELNSLENSTYKEYLQWLEKRT